jgi:hypothetical protein
MFTEDNFFPNLFFVVCLGLLIGSVVSNIINTGTLLTWGISGILALLTVITLFFRK